MSDQTRQNLFMGIKIDNVPYVTLQAWARRTYGSRGRPMTSLEQAEHDLYEKIRAKVPILQLQRQLTLVEELAKKGQDGKPGEEAQGSKKTVREDSLSDAQNDAPSSKRRKTANKVLVDDENMSPPPARRQHIYRANYEPSQSQQPLRETQLQAAAYVTVEELSQDLTTSSDAVVARHAQSGESRAGFNQKVDAAYAQRLHDHHHMKLVHRENKPLNNQSKCSNQGAKHLGSNFDARQTTAAIRRKTKARQTARDATSGLPIAPEEVETDYYSTSPDVGILSRRNQNDFAPQNAFDDEEHGSDRVARTELLAGFISTRTKKSYNAARRSVTHNQRTPGQSSILRGGTSSRDDNQSDADDSDELPECLNSGITLKRFRSKMKNAPQGSPTLSGRRAGPASTHDMLPPRLSDPAVIKKYQEPQDINKITSHRIKVGLPMGQNKDDSDSPPLSPSQEPRGRPSQPYTEKYKPSIAADPIKYKWVGRKRYRVIMVNKRNTRGEEVLREELCLSDGPDGCKSPPPRWQKFKLQGLNNRRVWSEDWNRKPDHQINGAQYYMVPVGEAINRPRLPVLELSRKHGIEKGQGSHCFEAGSVAGSVAPPSSITRQSKIFSVIKGHSVTNYDPIQKHDRSVMRITPVSSIADSGDAPERTLAQRLGLNIVATDSAQDRPTKVSFTPAPLHVGGQGSGGQLTLTNVAILEAQTDKPMHTAAVFRGKLRDVARGDESRMVWLGDETPRRPGSVAVSGRLHAASENFIESTRAVVVCPLSTAGSAARLPPLSLGSTLLGDPCVIDLDIPEDGRFISPAHHQANKNQASASTESSVGNSNIKRRPQRKPGFTHSRDPQDFDLNISEDNRSIPKLQTQREQELEVQIEGSKSRTADMEAELSKLSGLNVTCMESVDDTSVRGDRISILGQAARHVVQSSGDVPQGGPSDRQRFGSAPLDPSDAVNYGILHTIRTGMRISNGHFTYDDRGKEAFKGKIRGDTGGLSCGSQAQRHSYGGSQRDWWRGGGGGVSGRRKRDGSKGPPEGRNGGLKGTQRQPVDQNEEYERMRREAEEKYPFQEV